MGRFVDNGLQAHRAIRKKCHAKGNVRIRLGGKYNIQIEEVQIEIYISSLSTSRESAHVHQLRLAKLQILSSIPTKNCKWILKLTFGKKYLVGGLVNIYILVGSRGTASRTKP